MLNFNSLLLFSQNPKVLVDFYTKVLGQKPKWEMGDYTGYQVGNGTLGIMFHDKVQGKNQDQNRLIFNFETEEVEKEFERMKNAGAKVVQSPYKTEEGGANFTIATLEDPDGNLFQLVTPMK